MTRFHRSRFSTPAMILAALLCAWNAGPALAADRWAVVCGNNSYPNFKNQDLAGCESDAELVRRLLVETFDVPPGHVKMVLGKKATRKGILEALDWLAKTAKPGDSALFYFSGHGSQLKDENNDEADGLDEVLCPYDAKFVSRGKGKNFIIDDELAEIVSTISADREFIGIFDCCHSGTGLRILREQAGAKVKYLYYEEEDPPAKKATVLLSGGVRSLAIPSFSPPPPSDAESSLTDGFETPEARTRGWFGKKKPPPANPSTDGSPVPGSVLIAAAKSHELASETVVQRADNQKKEMHGILTIELWNFFRTVENPKEIPYRRLKALLDRPFVDPRGNRQNPQVELRETLLDRPFLGGGGLAGAMTAMEAPPTAPAPLPPKPTAVAPKPTPAASESIPETQEPTLFRVAVKRTDELAIETNAAWEILPEESDLLRKRLEDTVASMPDTARLVSPREPFHLLIAYCALGTKDSPKHLAVLIDSNTQISAVTDLYATPEALAQAARKQILRAWLVHSLLILRQPPASDRTVEIRVADPDILRGGVGETNLAAPPRRRDRFRIGESVVFRIRSSHDGYLTLLNIAPDGAVRLLYPNQVMTENEEGFLKGNEWLRLPGPGTGFEGDFPVEEPVGPECVKVFVTPRPLTGLPQILSGGANAGQAEVILRDLGKALHRSLDGAPARDASPANLASEITKRTDWAENALVFTTHR